MPATLLEKTIAVRAAIPWSGSDPAAVLSPARSPARQLVGDCGLQIPPCGDYSSIFNGSHI
jgi:hypothetical protein